MTIDYRNPNTVLPYDPCIGCFKGDTTTFFGIQGSREFLAAALISFAGVPNEEAVQIAAMFPNCVDRPQAIRLCQTCADKTGVILGTYLDESSYPTS
jgi:hypothetical protein